MFERQFARLFSADHPLSEQEAEDQWLLWRYGGGAQLAHRLIHYIGERQKYASRWHGAIRDWPGELEFAWGMRDPVATSDVLAGLREMRPAAPVTELPDSGMRAHAAGHHVRAPTDSNIRVRGCPPGACSVIADGYRFTVSMTKSGFSGGPRRLGRVVARERAGGSDISEEAALVVLAQQGDRGAFEDLVRRYSPRLQAVLLRIIREPEAAQDAAQDALLRAWQNIDRFQARSSFFTWLTRIGLNEAYRTIGRNQAVTMLPLDDAVGERVPGWGDRPDEVFDSREFLAAIEQALSRLPVEYRKAVVLRDVEGLSTSEAAEILGVGERALKSRLHRGRMALRRELDSFFSPD